MAFSGWYDPAGSVWSYTTCYNRFVRWLRAGVWSRIMDAFDAARGVAVQMIETSIVRVHRHGRASAQTASY